MEAQERFLSVLLEGTRLKVRSEQEVLERLSRIERIVSEVSRQLGINIPGQENESHGAAVAMSTDYVNEIDVLAVPAMDFSLESGQVSTTALQRKFRIGYTRAARMVDFFTEKGWVGPAEGVRPRSLLINHEQWSRIREEVLTR